jgi:alpha-beta hydrolase superfamily lysophospholipase
LYKDEVVLRVENISIVGRLFLNDEETDFPAVCLCHGAPSGDAPLPGDGGYPALAERFCREGYPTFFFNFRGAGDSGGNFDVAGWTRDLQAVVDYLRGREDIGKSPLYLVGFSAGAATAVYVASKDGGVAGVAACACPAEFIPFPGQSWKTLIERFRSIGSIRDRDFPQSPAAWIEGMKRVNPIRYISGIAPRPLLLVHGSLDNIVPVDGAHHLYEMAGNPKKLVVIEGAGHRLRRDERAVGAVLDWLRLRQVAA